MPTVILRDDDTNALTPPGYLERLYRPFLDRGLPVNLAVIPEVRTNILRPDGRPEGFIPDPEGRPGTTVPISRNRALIEYLRANPGFHIAQHGCHHDTFEFDRRDYAEICRRLELGRRRLEEAELGRPDAFVAPYDRFSGMSLRRTASQFRIISTGWFEWRRLPRRWLPGYVWHRARKKYHWRRGRTLLLRHPGCLLSCDRPYPDMLGTIRSAVKRQPLTVLVTHWWEYFRGGVPDEPFIAVLHSLAAWLAESTDIRVAAFDGLKPEDLSDSNGRHPPPARA